MRSAVAGYEVSLHRDELVPILEKIMREHTERKGCEWKPGAIEAILCDLAASVERQERCKGRTAA